MTKNCSWWLLLPIIAVLFHCRLENFATTAFSTATTTATGRILLNGKPSRLLLQQSSIPIDLVNNDNNNNNESTKTTTSTKQLSRNNNNNNNNSKKNKTTTTTPSDWHRQRRKDMISKYGDQITALERDNSQRIGLPLLAIACGGLWLLTIASASLPVWAVVALAIFPGSMFSLWQLQLLHDVIHGVLLEKKSKQLQDRLLFWGSMPSIFGYYLYLKAGHLSHHKNMGQHSLADVFESSSKEFEDGDVLFVAHRMKLKGDIGPQIPIPFAKNGSDEKFKMSISKSGFHFWKEGNFIANGLLFASSFMFERIMLFINDFWVAVLGKNLFFRNKPAEFQDDCVQYARVATAIRFSLWYFLGWKTLLFLYLSESLWSLPPHPACAMFITNHGSDMTENGECVPTKSTYAGPLYSIFTLGTNYHTEHHDFPTIPFHRLHELRQIAPEYYRTGSNDNVFQIMKNTFAHPNFYACMDAGSIAPSIPDEKQS